jgi:hypothetical protein
VLGSAGKTDSFITLTVEFTPPFRQKSPGMLSIRRQQVINDLDKVIAKALTEQASEAYRRLGNEAPALP